MAATLRGVQLWWKSCLDTGVVAVEKKEMLDELMDRPARKQHRRVWPFGGLPVPKTLLYRHYAGFCRDNRVAGTAEINSTMFKQLRQLVTFGRDEFCARECYAQQDALRPACLQFPTLEDCRASWCAKYGEVDTEAWGAGDVGDEVTYDAARDGHVYDEPVWRVN